MNPVLFVGKMKKKVNLYVIPTGRNMSFACQLVFIVLFVTVNEVNNIERQIIFGPHCRNGQPCILEMSLNWSVFLPSTNQGVQ